MRQDLLLSGVYISNFFSVINPHPFCADHETGRDTAIYFITCHSQPGCDGPQIIFIGLQRLEPRFLKHSTVSSAQHDLTETYMPGEPMSWHRAYAMA